MSAKLLIVNEDGFAIGGRARKYQAQLDTANLLGDLRGVLRAEGQEARAAGKLINAQSKALLDSIRIETASERSKLYPVAFYPVDTVPAKEDTAQPRKRIENWGKLNDDKPTAEVLEARAASGLYD